MCLWCSSPVVDRIAFGSVMTEQTIYFSNLREGMCCVCRSFRAQHLAKFANVPGMCKKSKDRQKKPSSTSFGCQACKRTASGGLRILTSLRTFSYQLLCSPYKSVHRDSGQTIRRFDCSLAAYRGSHRPSLCRFLHGCCIPIVAGRSSLLLAGQQCPL